MEKENVTLTSNEVVKSEKLIVKNDEIAKIVNKHFSETVDKLNSFEWPSCASEYTEDQLTNIINKYESHPSIKKIKGNYTIKQKFSFKPVTVMLLKIFLLTKLQVIPVNMLYLDFYKNGRMN